MEEHCAAGAFVGAHVTERKGDEVRLPKLLVLVMVLFPAAAAVGDISRTYSDGELLARATFATDGGNLLVTLENISPFDVTAPEQVLTAVYFDLADGVELTPVMAVLSSGSEVLFPVEGDGLDSQGEIGGEYAYRDDLTCGPSSRVIAASGLDDTLGPKHLFPGTGLWHPVSPNGLGYGLVSLGDNPTEGNAKVTGMVPLVQNGVVFTLTGLPANYDLAANLQNIEFNYGTEFSPTPVPGALVMGVMGMALIGWRTRRERLA